MDPRRLADIYHEYVVAQGLERLELLERVRAMCATSPTVLYPGCLIHVTPSFFFQHVVYVDRSDFARDFFAHGDEVSRIVNGRRRYRQSPFIRFVGQDFTRPIPVPEESFDVLMALYAVGVSRSCNRYLRDGGVLVTDDHHGDAADALAAGLTLEAAIKLDRAKLRWVDGDLSGFLEPRAESARAARTRTPGSKYARDAAFYIFRKSTR
jgi:SAM-dependent methyltransferase